MNSNTAQIQPLPHWIPQVMIHEVEITLAQTETRPAPIINSVSPSDEYGFPVLKLGGKFTIRGENFAADPTNEYIVFGPAGPTDGPPNDPYDDPQPVPQMSPIDSDVAPSVQPISTSFSSPTRLQAIVPEEVDQLVSSNLLRLCRLYVLTPEGGWSNFAVVHVNKS
jgi:hypothetical protein